MERREGAELTPPPPAPPAAPGECNEWSRALALSLWEPVYVTEFAGQVAAWGMNWGKGGRLDNRKVRWKGGAQT